MKKLLSDNNRFIDQQVFKYYSPYQAVIHGVVLLLLCMVLMGTVTLYFSIMNKKLVAILLNVISILFVLIFNNYRIGAMWLSPFCHACSHFIIGMFIQSFLYRLGIPMHIWCCWK